MTDVALYTQIKETGAAHRRRFEPAASAILNWVLFVWRSRFKTYASQPGRLGSLGVDDNYQLRVFGRLVLMRDEEPGGIMDCLSLDKDGNVLAMKR